MTRHRPFHGVRQLNVLQFDEGYGHTPVGSLQIKDIFDINVDPVGLASVSSKVCWPTTFLSVVRTIWLIASLMFSIAMTGLVASTTRYYERAETSTLTLSRIVMPWN
jgi:hypothetical protein